MYLNYLSISFMPLMWVWLPAWAIWTIGGTIGGLLVGLGVLSKIPHDTKAICVVGTRQSGKTTLFEIITERFHGSGEGGTSWKVIKEVVIKVGKKRLKLKKTLDLGGGNDYVREYKELIEDKDFVFIIFNLNELMNSKEQVNKEQVLEFQSRLIAISKYLKGRKYQVIGSHLDKIKISDNEYEKRRKKYVDLIERKYLDKLDEFNIDKHFIMLNLTDRKAMKKYIEDVFSELMEKI